MSADYAEQLAKTIIDEFMGNVLLKNIDVPLEEGEEPPVFQIEKKFVIIPYYLDNEFVKLPLICKQLSHESEEVHMLRVKKYLLTCDKTTFTQIAHLIDPDDEIQKGFHNLYDEVTQERI